jgi:hypothetical protein
VLEVAGEQRVGGAGGRGPTADLVGYRQIPLWLSRDELTELIGQVTGAVVAKGGQPASARAPSRPGEPHPVPDPPAAAAPGGHLIGSSARPDAAPIAAAPICARRCG